VVSHIKRKNRLRVFEHMALGKIFGHKKQGVTGDWREIHNEKLHALHCLANIIRRLSWIVHVDRMENDRNE
jgi:hypothetical protein